MPGDVLVAFAAFTASSRTRELFRRPPFEETVGITWSCHRRMRRARVPELEAARVIAFTHDAALRNKDRRFHREASSRRRLVQNILEAT